MSATDYHTGKNASLLTRSYRAVGACLTRFGESSPSLRKAEKLNEISEEKLVELGLSRDGALRHVLRNKFL